MAIAASIQSLISGIGNSESSGSSGSLSNDALGQSSSFSALIGGADSSGLFPESGAAAVSMTRDSPNRDDTDAGGRTANAKSDQDGAQTQSSGTSETTQIAMAVTAKTSGSASGTVSQTDSGKQKNADKADKDDDGTDAVAPVMAPVQTDVASVDGGVSAETPELTEYPLSPPVLPSDGGDDTADAASAADVSAADDAAEEAVAAGDATLTDEASEETLSAADTSSAETLTTLSDLGQTLAQPDAQKTAGTDPGVSAQAAMQVAAAAQQTSDAVTASSAEGETEEGETGAGNTDTEAATDGDATDVDTDGSEEDVDIRMSSGDDKSARGSSDSKSAANSTGTHSSSASSTSFSSALFSLTSNNFGQIHNAGQQLTAQNSTLMNAQLQMQQAAVNSDAVTLDDLSLSIATRASQGVRMFNINLSPAELGRVEVKLSFSSGGTTHAHITADSPKTLQLLQQDASSLAKQLADAGVDLSGGGLNFSLRQGNSQQNFSGTQSDYGDSKAVSLEAVTGTADAADTETSSLIPMGFDSDQIRLDIRV